MGITEHFEEDIHYFATNFLPPEAGPVLERHLQRQKLPKKHIQDEALRREILQIHYKDWDLYQQALAMREIRGGGE